MKPRPSFIALLLISFMLSVWSTAHTPLVTGKPAGPARVNTDPSTERVSVATDGSEANGPSDEPAISARGRYVAFSSQATNLIAGDNNGVADIFLRDRLARQTIRISIATGGAEANGASHSPAVSAFGRYVVFESDASNLVTGDTNGATDIFFRDRGTGETSRLSVGSGGAQANGNSRLPTVSDDARYVVFESDASNLVTGDTNGVTDIFLYDRQTGQTTRVSVAADGTEADNTSFLPDISADGSHIAFISNAGNLVAGDTNGVFDIFIRNRQTGQVERVSVSSGGIEANGDSFFPSLSTDGSVVAFFSAADNLILGDLNGVWDVFVRDRQAGQTSRISVADDGTAADDNVFVPSISADGRYVAFFTGTDKLVPGDVNAAWDIFVRDRGDGLTTRVSVASDGTQADDASYLPSISGDARFVAFASLATNLVPGDANNVQDIFIRDRGSSISIAFLPLTLHNYPPTYSVSGQVVDDEGAPVPGVTVTTDTGTSATAGPDGRYTLIDLLAGTYTITPAKSGYTFAPTSRTVSLPPDAINQDFTASLIPTPTPTPTPPPPPTPTPVPCTEVVANGGFEWDGSWELPLNEFPAAYSTTAAHSGGRSMRVGIINLADNRLSYSSARQWVQIPANAASATFSFWLYPVSGEAPLIFPASWQAPDVRDGALVDDAQFVLLFDQSGQQHTLLFQRRNDQTWMSHQFDLISFAGQTIQLYFGAFNNGFDGVTGMYADDVSLHVCQP
ncbi:MAG: carboxypeptidase regulatory-like domain-containing protein [Anaerolineae bacterium]